MGDGLPINKHRAIKWTNISTVSKDRTPDLSPTDAARAYSRHDAGVDFMRAAINGSRSSAEKISRAESFARAYKEGSELALEAIAKDPYVDFVDTFGMTGRMRAADVAAAVVAVNVALQSVVDDMKSGRLDIPLEQMLEVAASRLRGASITDGFFSRSVASVVAPNAVGMAMMNSSVGRAIAVGALAVASAAPAAREHALKEANLGVAYALYKHGEMPANSNAALPAILDLAGISPIAELSFAPDGATASWLEDQVDDGAIDGFFEAGGQLYTYRLKSAQAIAREVNTKIASGELDDLSVDARVALGVMLGPDDQPGEELAARLAREGRNGVYRQFAGAVIETAAIGFASGGIGTIAESAAIGARLGSLGVRTARFIAASASFTTMMGMKNGHLSAGDYARDAAMFGVLAQASKLAPIAAKLIPGSGIASRIVQLAVAHGVSVGAASVTMSGAQVLEELASGRDPRWRTVRDGFVQNLVVVGTLHGVGVALEKLAPSLAAGGPTSAEYDRLVRDHGRAANETTKALAVVQSALERGDVATAERGVAALDAAKVRAESAADALVEFATRVLGAKTGAEVAGAIDGARAGLADDGAARARLDKQRGVEADIGRDATRSLGGEVGGDKVEKLHDKVDAPLVTELGTARGKDGQLKHKKLASDLAEIDGGQAAVLKDIHGSSKSPADTVDVLHKRGEPTRFLAGEAKKRAGAAQRQVESDQRVAQMRARLRASGFFDSAAVKGAVARSEAQRLRGMIGEELGRLEALRSYPVNEGYRVLVGVLVCEAVTAPGKGTFEVNGRFWRPVTDIDTLVLKSRNTNAKDSIVLLEQQKASSETHAQAQDQNERARNVIQRIANGDPHVALFSADADITNQIDARSIDGARLQTRGLTGRSAFDTHLGVTDRELDQVIAEKINGEEST